MDRLRQHIGKKKEALHPALKGALIGGGVGAAGGGLLGYRLPTAPLPPNKKNRMAVAKQLALAGGLSGASIGAMLGKVAHLSKIAARVTSADPHYAERANPYFDKLAFEAFVDEMMKVSDIASVVLGQLARREVTPPVTRAVGDVEESIADKWRRFSTQNLLD